MEEPTLGSVLKQKYGIKERLLVEGRFVALLENSNDAVSLVSLGLSRKCFVVALVNLATDTIDFELMSLTPLSLLSFTCYPKSKRLKISSVFKTPQVYQLCCSTKQPEIWDRFTTQIKCLNAIQASNVWIMYPDNINIKPGPPPMAYDQVYSQAIYKWSSYQKNEHRMSLTTARDIKECCQSMERSASVPCIISSVKNEDKSKQKPPLRRCATWYDVKFDNFVNDAPPLYLPFNVALSKSRWRESVEDLLQLERNFLDKSNNQGESDKDDEDGAEGNGGDAKPDDGEKPEETEKTGGEKKAGGKVPGVIKKILRICKCCFKS